MIIVVPKAALPRVRAALAKLEGLPLRGQTLGGEDRVPSTPGAGWTTDAIGDVDEDDTSACFTFPESLRRHLGKTITVGGQSITLPTEAELIADEDALPETLRAIRAARASAGP